jgi:heme/copper-type cytochrome/quinol oxidase subunit 3
VGTLVLVAAESMLFLGLASSFVLLRSQYLNWPPMGQPRLGVVATGVNTLVLLASWFAVRRAGREGAQQTRLLGLGAVLGLCFLVGQGREWWVLVDYGLSSASVYGSLFYAIVGTHAVHVLVSVGVLGWATARSHRRRWTTPAQAALETWWSFVVGLWPLLYAMVYLW